VPFRDLSVLRLAREEGARDPASHIHWIKSVDWACLGDRLSQA